MNTSTSFAEWKRVRVVLRFDERKQSRSYYKLMLRIVQKKLSSCVQTRLWKNSANSLNNLCLTNVPCSIAQKREKSNSMQRVIVILTVEDVSVPKWSVRETCPKFEVTITRSARAQSEQGGKWLLKRPGARFSKAPETFRVRKAIAKSRTLRVQSCFIHII